ncbi:PsbP-related protein [Methanobacterium oryzae]|uniref:PsbP-related protein n=1 Tax=Methanobacterium oryzae TaxID=69540 RepID=UPI003D262700
MKKWISIIAIMLVVVCAAGCIDSSPKTYTGNGLSFQYPADWSSYESDLQKSMGSSGDVLVSLGKGDEGVFVAKMNLGTAQVSASEFADAFKSSASSGRLTFVSEKTVTVDGSTGYEKVFKYTENSTQLYASCTFVKNNGTIYMILIGTPNNDQETVDMILNSFKFT